LSWKSSVADMDWAVGGSMARPLSSRGRTESQEDDDVGKKAATDLGLVRSDTGARQRAEAR
jgi:hypothetical protein